MSSSCEHVLEIVGPASDRHAVCSALFDEESPGLVDADGQLPPLKDMTSWPRNIRYRDDGTSLWVYWETLRRGACVGWCERISLAFPTVTVRVQYLYENDLGAGRLCWQAGHVIENLDLITDEGAFGRVTNDFYELVGRTCETEEVADSKQVAATNSLLLQ
jgi:hypothetical protein